MQRLTEDQKRSIWVTVMVAGYTLLCVHSSFFNPAWRFPEKILELLTSAALSAFALITLLRDFRPKSRVLEVISVSSDGKLVSENQSEKRDLPEIPVHDPTLRKVFYFCLERSTSVRLLMFILTVFLLMGTIFDRHGYLVVENQYFQLCMNYCHNLAIAYVLFRLIKPKDTEDLLGLLIAVITSVFGHVYYAVQSAFLYILVISTRWWRTSRLIGVLVYTVFVTPTILVGVSVISSEGPSSTTAAAQLCTMDGIYHLVKSYEGVRLYREVQLLPGVYLRKDLDYKKTGWPSYANIQKVADGKYEITTGEPPPEYFK